MSNFDNEVIEVIKKFCEMNHYEFRDNYSMFGQSCVGYVTSEPLISLMYLCDALNEEYDDASANLIKNEVMIDNMGLDYIIYFPYLSRR